MKWIYVCLRWLRRLLFPPRCVACRNLLDWKGPDGSIFCDDCLDKWESAKRAICYLCGHTVSVCTCQTELMQKARCRGLRKLVYYRHGKSDALQNRLLFFLKRNRHRESNRFLAEQWMPTVEQIRAACVGELTPLCITFILRGRRARLEYGTDQAQELAKALSKCSGIPCEGLIVRTRQGQKIQKKLTAQARLQNAKRAFVLSENADVKGKAVIVVDDIVTTGASMAVVGKLLRRAGASAVWGLAIAADDSYYTPN